MLFNPPAPSGRGFTREGRCTQESGVWGTQWPPLTLATAAALLRREGFSVTVRDYPASGLNIAALQKDICRHQPDLAIWSTGAPTLSFDLAIARLVRDYAPQAVTAVMGTYVTALPAVAFEEPALDIVVRGEPEGIIGELAGNGSALQDIRGISWRDDQGQVRHNPDASPLVPEAIPAPDWGGVDLDAYRLPLKGRRFLMAAPVRGCPYRCTFCAAPLYYGSKLRRRPVENVLDEIEADIARYRISEFLIWADTFTADRGYVRDFCNAILNRKLKISWTCNSRADTIDEETLRVMKKAGLWMMSFGIESGNDVILAKSLKGITAAQSRAAVEMTKKAGIKTAGHFIFGLPGETRKTMEETLAFALSLPLDFAQFYAAAPFPGTALYDTALREGWLNIPKTTVPDVGKSGETGDGGLRQDGLPRLSTVVEGSQNHAVMELPGLPSGEVDKFRRYAFRRFYGRFVTMARVLSMVEPGVFANIFSVGQRFRRWIT